MKKVFFIALCFLFCHSSAKAQKLKQGSLDFLKGEKELNIVIDYTSAIIDKKAKRILLS